MKTAISLPDSLFDQAEAEARRLNVSRSELYSRALAEFLKRNSDADITQRLNQVYESNQSNVDPALHAVQVRLFGKESW